jgi:hypothetical protein
MVRVSRGEEGGLRTLLFADEIQSFTPLGEESLRSVYPHEGTFFSVSDGVGGGKGWNLDKRSQTQKALREQRPPVQSERARGRFDVSGSRSSNHC